MRECLVRAQVVLECQGSDSRCLGELLPSQFESRHGSAEKLLLADLGLPVRSAKDVFDSRSSEIWHGTVAS